MDSENEARMFDSLTAFVYHSYHYFVSILSQEHHIAQILVQLTNGNMKMVP